MYFLHGEHVLMQSQSQDRNLAKSVGKCYLNCKL